MVCQSFCSATASTFTGDFEGDGHAGIGHAALQLGRHQGHDGGFDGKALGVGCVLGCLGCAPGGFSSSRLIAVFIALQNLMAAKW